MSSGGTSFGTNTNAQRKRVYYAGDSTIYEGMPVCYDYLATRNVLGYDKGAGGDPGCQTSPTTTAEGNQNEGKFLRVVNPINVSTAGGTFTSATKLLEDAEFTSTELVGVGTTVSVASSTDDDIDGNYEVTAVSDGVSITLGGMTDAEAATVTTGITDVTVILNNLDAFAGVVASGKKVGKTGPCWLDIFIPNGAIVPVRTDSNCLIDQTILAVSSAQQELGTPLASGARAVAIAKETVDRGTAGLVLAELNPSRFMYQVSQGGALSIDDADSGTSVAVNKININSLQTSGSVGALYVILNTATVSNHSGLYFELGNTGTGAAGFHVINLYGEAAGTAITADVNGIKTQMNLLAGSGLSNAGIAAGIFAKAEVKAGAGTIAGDVVGGRFSVGHGATVTGDTAMLYFDHTGSNIDYFFKSKQAGAIALEVVTSGTTASHHLPIRVGSTTYYILVEDTA